MRWELEKRVRVSFLTFTLVTREACQQFSRLAFGLGLGLGSGGGVQIRTRRGPVMVATGLVSRHACRLTPPLTVRVEAGVWGGVGLGLGLGLGLTAIPPYARRLRSWPSMLTVRVRVGVELNVGVGKKG